MDQMSGDPIRRRVVVPVDGLTVDGARREAEAGSGPTWLVDGPGLDPDSREARWVHMLQPEPDWVAVVTFEVTAAGAVATGVEIRSTRGRQVTRAVWDWVKVAAVIREAVAQTAWLAPVTGRYPLPEQPPTARTGRPPEYTDEHYRRVGVVYSAALADDDRPRPPVRAVATAFEGQPHPRDGKPMTGLTRPGDKRARGWVRAARARGYITDSTTHRKGGDR